MFKYILCFLFIVFSCGVNAQSDSTQLNKNDTTLIANNSDAADASDDEFNVFLFVIAVGFIGAALGAVMAGVFVVFLLLGMAVLLTLAGITSASLLMGLYKRSLKSGFKSFMLISLSIFGSVFGLFILWFINQFFHLYLAGSQLLLAGAGGGLIGGFLLGLLIYRMMKVILNKLLTRFKLLH